MLAAVQSPTENRPSNPLGIQNRRVIENPERRGTVRGVAPLHSSYRNPPSCHDREAEVEAIFEVAPPEALRA